MAIPTTQTEHETVSSKHRGDDETALWNAFYVPRAFWWTVFFLVWTVQAGLYAFASYYSGRGTAAETLQVALYDWYTWALVCLVCFWIAKRLPLEHYPVRRLIPILALATVAVTFGRGVVDQGVMALTGWDDVDLVDRLIRTLPGRVILVLTFIGVGYGIQYIRMHQERERRAARLRSELAAAQLQMLKVQLHPHFLFNTLNTISSLMYVDVPAADRMLVRLSELLRRTLQTIDAQRVSLAEELSFLEPYLEIEQTRLAHRLKVVMSLEPGTLAATVPHLILQPIVENAIRHGISLKVEGGTLTIESSVRDGRLRLMVTDDGVGIGVGSGETGRGIGLANSRARLSHLYGENASFDLRTAPGGGVRVTIELPYEPADLGSSVADSLSATVGTA